jgi:hypothetical protein
MRSSALAVREDGTPRPAACTLTASENFPPSSRLLCFTTTILGILRRSSRTIHTPGGRLGWATRGPDRSALAPPSCVLHPVPRLALFDNRCGACSRGTFDAYANSGKREWTGPTGPTTFARSSRANACTPRSGATKQRDVEPHAMPLCPASISTRIVNVRSDYTTGVGRFQALLCRRIHTCRSCESTIVTNKARTRLVRIGRRAATGRAALRTCLLPRGNSRTCSPQVLRTSQCDAASGVSTPGAASPTLVDVQ